MGQVAGYAQSSVSSRNIRVSVVGFHCGDRLRYLFGSETAKKPLIRASERRFGKPGTNGKFT